MLKFSDNEKRKEVLYEQAKLVYEYSLERFHIEREYAYRLTQISGLVASIAGAILVLILKNPQNLIISSYFTYPLCGGIGLLIFTILLSLNILRGREKARLDPTFISETYEKSDFNKKSQAKEMLKAAEKNEENVPKNWLTCAVVVGEVGLVLVLIGIISLVITQGLIPI